MWYRLRFSVATSKLNFCIIDSYVDCTELSNLIFNNLVLKWLKSIVKIVTGHDIRSFLSLRIQLLNNYRTFFPEKQKTNARKWYERHSLMVRS